MKALCRGFISGIWKTVCWCASSREWRKATTPSSPVLEDSTKTSSPVEVKVSWLSENFVYFLFIGGCGGGGWRMFQHLKLSIHPVEQGESCVFAMTFPASLCAGPLAIWQLDSIFRGLQSCTRTEAVKAAALLDAVLRLLHFLAFRTSVSQATSPVFAVDMCGELGAGTTVAGRWAKPVQHCCACRGILQWFETQNAARHYRQHPSEAMMNLPQTGRDSSGTCQKSGFSRVQQPVNPNIMIFLHWYLRGFWRTYAITMSRLICRRHLGRLGELCGVLAADRPFVCVVKVQ